MRIVCSFSQNPIQGQDKFGDHHTVEDNINICLRGI
jgi:hypothetical protein